MSKQKETKKDRYKERVCLDCNIAIGGCGSRRTSFNIGYMLNNDLWKKIINNENGSSKGLLCIICAQLRLGRKVKPSDFKPVPLNLRDGGMLWMLFPDALKNHMKDFVADEASDEEE